MRTTLNINDSLYRALKRQAADTGQTMTVLVEEALVAQVLENASDAEAAARRAREPANDFAELVRQFKAEGLL